MKHRYTPGHVLDTDDAYGQTPAEPPRRKSESVRISIKSLLSVGAVLFAIVTAWSDLKSDSRNMRTIVDEHTTALAKRDAADAETMRMLISLNAKVEVLLSREPGRTGSQ